jgi:surface protein
MFMRVMCSQMFQFASAFNQTISSWNVASVVNMASMFSTSSTAPFSRCYGPLSLAPFHLFLASWLSSSASYLPPG